MGFTENLQRSRNAMDPDKYRAELKDMGASDEDADASRAELIRRQREG